MPITPVQIPTSPADMTGRATENRAKAAAKAKADERERLANEALAEATALATGVYDPAVQAPIVLDEVVTVGVSLADDTVIIRTIVDIDEMTYGVNNTYTFKAGVKYRVPKDLAGYLEQMGYTWLA